MTASALSIGLAGVLVAGATAGDLSLPVAVLSSITLLTLLALAGVGVAGRSAAPPVPAAAPAGGATLARP